MKTKKILFYSLFFLIFLIQSGIIYILVVKPSIIYVIESFLFSSLTLFFSGGFILLYIGAKKDDASIRLLGYLLIGITFSSVMFAF